MDKIALKNIKFYAYHGVLEKEREVGQNFFIDVEMYLNLEKSGITDNLEDTVDYSNIYDIIKCVTLNNKFKLIEALAHRISDEILYKHNKIYEIIVRVRKPEAPISGEFDWAEVEVKRRKNVV